MRLLAALSLLVIVVATGCGGPRTCGGDPCCGDPCCGDSCCGDPCCGDPCCGDACCGDPCCGQCLKQPPVLDERRSANTPDGSISPLVELGAEER